MIIILYIFRLNIKNHLTISVCVVCFSSFHFSRSANTEIRRSRHVDLTPTTIDSFTNKVFVMPKTNIKKRQEMISPKRNAETL